MTYTVNDIARDIKCLVCQNQSILDSETPFADDVKSYIQTALDNGENKAEILEFLVGRYGDFILLSPPINEYTIALWVIPVLILVFLLYIARQSIGESCLSNKLQKRDASLSVQKKHFYKIITVIFVLVIAGSLSVYSKIGSFGMSDYPLNTGISSGGNQVELMLKQARNWREVDFRESQRIYKINQQVLSLDRHNTEALWFTGIYHLENDDKVLAEQFLKSAIESSSDIQLKNTLTEEMNILLN